MLFINRHSFLLTGAMVVGSASLLAAWFGMSALTLGLVAGAILAFTALFWWLGAGPSSHPQAQPVLDLIGAGTPVLLEFQSAY